MSAMLMAIYFSGMNERETLCLTMSMMDSGDVNDLSGIRGVRPTSIHRRRGGQDLPVLCPMLAAHGVKMAKLSGRGLGHTGGTIDKLESFKELSPPCHRSSFSKTSTRWASPLPGRPPLWCLRTRSSTPCGRHRHRAQPSTDRQQHHEQEACLRRRRHRPGCKDRQRRFHENR